MVVHGPTLRPHSKRRFLVRLSPKYVYNPDWGPFNLSCMFSLCQQGFSLGVPVNRRLVQVCQISRAGSVEPPDASVNILTLTHIGADSHDVTHEFLGHQSSIFQSYPF